MPSGRAILVHSDGFDPNKERMTWNWSTKKFMYLNQISSARLRRTEIQNRALRNVPVFRLIWLISTKSISTEPMTKKTNFGAPQA